MGYSNRRTVLLTGATGIMGSATLRQLTEMTDRLRIKVLSRPSKKNQKHFAPLQKRGDVEVVWGDLTSPSDVARAVEGADIVLHVGGLVSPEADMRPEATWRVNTGSIKNIVNAVKARPDSDNVTVVYIGSVSQYGPRLRPLHWGRVGDPMIAAIDDVYALSKIAGERILAESGLRRWISLRQTSILSPELLMKGSDPITFHVPLAGVLEWVTAEQSGRLLARLCDADIPDEALRRFYNVGGGESFRMTNYEFEKRFMEALSCPPPEKVFETDWFATRNFHGVWYSDSDALEKLFPFRGDEDCDGYFRSMASSLPAWSKLAAIAPAWLIKSVMKHIACKPPLGTLSWKNSGDEQRTAAFFGSEARRDAIPGWESADLSRPSETPCRLSHGYDESKPESELSIEDMREAARFRGGRCLSETMTTGNLYAPLEWECCRGHRFRANPATVIVGGHWCPDCFPMPENHQPGERAAWRYDEEARHNPFLAQAWHSTHGKEELRTYLGTALPDV